VLLNQMSGMVQKEQMSLLHRWAGFWTLWTSVRFLKAYLNTAGDAAFLPRSRNEVLTLLDVFLLEKAVYELGYELNNRPSWIRVPLRGILRILESRE